MQRSIADFSGLASATGGEGFLGTSGESVLPAILKQMAKHLQYDYVAGFYPASSGGQRRHRVEAVLRAKERGQIVGGTRMLVY